MARLNELDVLLNMENTPSDEVEKDINVEAENIADNEVNLVAKSVETMSAKMEGRIVMKYEKPSILEQLKTEQARIKSVGVDKDIQNKHSDKSLII